MKELNAKQQAIADALWTLIDDYARCRAHPVNGPDPSMDAAKAILDLTIKSLVREAV